MKTEGGVFDDMTTARKVENEVPENIDPQYPLL